MTITRTFAGYDQPDVAALQIGSVHYCAHAYRVVRPAGTGVTGGVAIRVRCFVTQPNAQTVELFDTEVRSSEAAALDCPKIIAVGTTFVVCWLERADEETLDLHMSSLNIQTLGAFGPNWDYHASIPTHAHGLFDLVVIDTGQYFEHHATDFIIAHQTDVDELTVRRHNGFEWVDTDWITAFTAPANIACSVIAAYAYEELLEPAVLVTYQTDAGGANAAGVVRTVRFTSTSGVQTHDEASFTAIPAAVRCGTATHARLGNFSIALVIEYARDDDLTAGDDYVRWLAGVELDDRTCAQRSSEMAVANLHLLSRPFALPGLSDELTPTPRLFAAVAFKNMGAVSEFEPPGTPVESGTDWVQSLGFIVDLDWRQWNDTSDLEARPFIVSQIPFTIADARVAGYIGQAVGDFFGSSSLDARRINHPSHVADPPDFGPSVKSVTVSIGAFGRSQNVGISTSALEADGSRLLPVAAMTFGWEFDYEDPWIVWRDDRSQPLANWKGIHELPQHQAVNVGRHLVLGGGTPLIYDGIQLVELGFAWDPEIVSVTGTLEGGEPDGLGGGAYLYTAIYEQTDNFGVVHRSGPAAPVTITMDDPGPDSNQVVLRIRTMTASLRDNVALYPDSHAINIVIYRTVANGQTFYRLHSLDNAFSSIYAAERTPVNDPMDWAIEFTDTLPDSALTAASDVLPWPILDASGNPIPLEPNRVPAACVMAVFQERLWLASLEDSDELRYSLTLRKGFAPEFNDVNVLRRDNMGPVTGLAAMDQQMIVFTPDRIYSVVGRVQDDTGSDGDLSVHLLAEGVGCVCARSIVVTAGDGIFFQSRKGYYQLDRGGGTMYIGQEVEDYIRDAGTVLGATLLEGKHQVRVVCNSAPGGTQESPTTEPIVLVYDYRMKKWTRSLPAEFEDDERRSEAAHGCAWRGHDGEVSHVLLQAGAVGIERASSDTPFADYVDDDDIAIPVDVQTGWIHVAGMGGVQRIWTILLTLDKPNASQLTVTLEFDQGGYGTADVTQSIVFASGTAMPLRCRPSVQKCTAFRIRIRESGTVPTTENISITGITLVAGVKRGHSKVPAAQIG